MGNDDPDDLRALPKDDTVHYLMLRRMDILEQAQKVLEQAHKEFDQWRFKADAMLDNVGHLETRFNTTIEKQTGQILGKLSSVETELARVMKDRTFWANSRTIAKWIIGTGLVLTPALWAVFTFVYEHLHRMVQ